MDGRISIFRVVASAILLGALGSRADPVPTSTPARGTVEYAKRHALYAPRPKLSAGMRYLSGKGLFALHIRPDGTVSDVQTLQTTGHNELDNTSIAAFSKWRFYPGQVKVLRIPIAYIGRHK
jgi:TonB family protein